MTASLKTRLFWTVRPEPVPLATVLTEATGALGPGAVGFLSSPGEHFAVRLEGATARTAAGPVDLAGVFAARLFTPDAELRWVQSGGGSGDAVLLTEEPAVVPGWVGEQAAVTDVLNGSYVLWGRRFETAATGWCRALEGRLGALDLPLDGPLPAPGPAGRSWPAEYLALVYREYLGVDGHGNAHVFEERLMAIILAAPTVGAGEATG